MPQSDPSYSPTGPRAEPDEPLDLEYTYTPASYPIRNAETLKVSPECINEYYIALYYSRELWRARAKKLVEIAKDLRFDCWMN